MRQLTVCEHPVLQDALAQLRDRNTRPKDFRDLMETAGAILGLEALKGVKTGIEQVHTPLKAMHARRVAQPVSFVFILRAGQGLYGGLHRLYPQARIGHIGLYRNEETLNPVRYYVRLPVDLPRSLVLLFDPMLATGGSAAEGIRILKTDGAKEIRLITLLAAKTGVRRVHREHPDVHIFTAAVDPVLNKHGYIVPGLGDAGDRLYTL
ncbi:MAG: uracil phosphoribosyltransferase [Elusimicrobiota bacterium]|jgi:uracil phosphoribosyltransferase